MLEVIDSADISYKTKSKNKMIICRLCKSGETRSESDGNPIWTKDVDSHGTFTGSYLCYKCTFGLEKICCKCGTDDIDRQMTKCYEDDGYWYGRFLCDGCSANMREKKKAYCRNKNLDPDSPIGIGYITEVLVARFLEIRTCFDMTDNFNHKAFDMYESDNFGKIDVKGSTFNKRYRSWRFHTNRNTCPDFFFCIGYDENRKNVDRVYVIPNDIDISNKMSLTISESYSKYDVFRYDEKPWNDIFHTMKLDDCPVLQNRYRDIN